MEAYLAMTLMRQRSVKAFEVYSQKVRYQTAKGVFFKGKGELERQAMSLEELVTVDEVPDDEVISLETVVGEPHNYPQIHYLDLPLDTVQLGLILEVAGKKKGMVRKAIEERALNPHQMVKLKPQGKEYELTFVVEEDDAISKIANQMEWDMELLAELDDCLVKVKWLGAASNMA